MAQGVEQLANRTEGLPGQRAAADQPDHHDDCQQRAEERADDSQEAIPLERRATDLENGAVDEPLGGDLEPYRAPRAGTMRHPSPSPSCSSAYEPQLAGMLVSRISALAPTSRTNTWSSLPEACSAATARLTPATPALSNRAA